MRVPPAVMPWFSSSPPGAEQAQQLGKVARQLRPPDMLEHADRGDLVERLVVGQLAVVQQLDAHAAGQAALADQPLHMGVLVLRQA